MCYIIEISLHSVAKINKYKINLVLESKTKGVSAKLKCLESGKLLKTVVLELDIIVRPLCLTNTKLLNTHRKHAELDVMQYSI